jgi:biopolymer transport protein ExbB
MSLLVVTLGVERLVTFRRNRLIPRKLVRRLEALMRAGDGCLDAEAAMVACREHRSVTATVVTSMLMRVGRPLSEIEQAANETAQREADGQAGPIRWLNLAAAATPLMGLLGTVWGMIVAFHNSTTLTADRSRSEQLSEGIYTALVTTLAGLAVAIPAAILAQYLENRLTKLFHRIEKLAFSLSPSLEHYEGRVRMDADQRIRPLQEGVTPAVPPPVVSEGSAVDRQAGSERTVGDGRGVSSPHRRASDAAVRQR